MPRNTQRVVSTSGADVPLVSVVAPGTQTTDVYGRNAGQVGAVTGLAGTALQPNNMTCHNFDGNSTSISWAEGMADISRSHVSSNNLIGNISTATTQVQQATTATTRAAVGAFSYDSMLQSVLTDGEVVQAGLQFDSINFFAKASPTAPAMPAAACFYNGRFLLSDQRLLALSCSPAQEGSVTKFGHLKKNRSWISNTVTYQVKHKQSDNIAVKMWPLGSVKASDLHISTFSEATTTLIGRLPACALCCCKNRSWSPAQSPPIAMVSRKLNLYLDNAPWIAASSYRIELNLSNTETPQSIQTFLQKLQELCPGAGGLDESGGNAPMRR